LGRGEASRRQRRVGELLREELSELLLRRMKDPRLENLVITGVDVSPDLRRAHIYVSCLGSEDERKEALKVLRGAGGFVRRALGASLSLRYVPEVLFHWDEALERGRRVLDIIRNLEEGDS
jgi:ribosome-binding factor A